MKNNYPTLCSVHDCNEKCRAKGLCYYHYQTLKNRGEIGTKKCSVEQCHRFAYAKGFCRLHLLKFNRSGTAYTKKQCPFPGCNKQIRHYSTYCSTHKIRAERCRKKNLPITASRYDLFSNKNNPRWNNGTSDYPNHYQMKLMRKRKVIETNGLCEQCKLPGRVIHHKDLTKSNHDYLNFIFLCRKCHIKEHKKMGTKYGRPPL